MQAVFYQILSRTAGPNLRLYPTENRVGDVEGFEFI